MTALRGRAMQARIARPRMPHLLRRRVGSDCAPTGPSWLGPLDATRDRSREIPLRGAVADLTERGICFTASVTQTVTHVEYDPPEEVVRDRKERLFESILSECRYPHHNEENHQEKEPILAQAPTHEGCQRIGPAPGSQQQ